MSNRASAAQRNGLRQRKRMRAQAWPANAQVAKMPTTTNNA